MASTTRDRLLSAAEHLFAENGYDATSTRAIIDEAGAANSAAINYYFGSKEGLLRAVLDNVLVGLFTQQREALQSLATKPDGAAAVLATVVGPAVDLHRGPRGPVVARLLGHIVADPTQSMRAIALNQAALIEAAVAEALMNAAPHLSREEARIRYAGVMAVLSFYLIGMFDDARHDPPLTASPENDVDYLVAMLAGIVEAPTRAAHSKGKTKR